MPSRARLRSAAVTALVALSLPLAGCSIAEDLVNQGIREATGSEAEISLGSVPSDFPATIPLPEGDVLLSGKPTANSWAVTVRVADATAAQAAADAVEAAGFTPLFDGATAYENDVHHVALTWADVDGGVGVAFVVTTR